jgi:hypothetical protein
LVTELKSTGEKLYFNPATTQSGLNIETASIERLQVNTISNQ